MICWPLYGHISSPIFYILIMILISLDIHTDIDEPRDKHIRAYICLQIPVHKYIYIYIHIYTYIYICICIGTPTYDEMNG